MNLSLRYLVVQRFSLCPFFQFSESNRVMISDIYAAKQFSSFLVSRCSSQVFRSNFGYFLKCAIVFESLDYKNTLFTSLLTISDTVSSLVSDCQFSNCNNRAIYCDKTSSNLTILKSDFFYCGVDHATGGSIYSISLNAYLMRLCFVKCYAISDHCNAFFCKCTNSLEASYISCYKCPNTEYCWNHVSVTMCPYQVNRNQNYTSNKMAVNAGLEVAEPSTLSILEFYTSIGHTAGGALCFYSMSISGNHRYGNIIGNTITGTYQGSVLFEKASTSLSYFYFSGNTGPYTCQMTSGSGTFLSCIFDRNSIINEIGCQTCISCIFSTEGMSKNVIFHLNTGLCEGEEMSFTQTYHHYSFHILTLCLLYL